MNWLTTNRITRTRSFPLGMALLVPLLAFPAMAALGGDAASIQQDAAHFKAQVRMTQKQAYAVHEMQTAGGATVREYVSPAGKVFGVAWQGPVIPDLQQLLGSYFTRFQATAQNRRGIHGPLVIHEAGLVLESTGHMTAYRGSARVPEMLPEGVHSDAIQ
jgi:Protein of unknown function (DUF2844)